jgi:hypothetical protein
MGDHHRPFRRDYLLRVDTRNNRPRSLAQTHKALGLEANVGVDEDKVRGRSPEEIARQNVARQIDIAAAAKHIDGLDLDALGVKRENASGNRPLALFGEGVISRHGDTHAPCRLNAHTNLSL